MPRRCAVYWLRLAAPRASAVYWLRLAAAWVKLMRSSTSHTATTQEMVCPRTPLSQWCFLGGLQSRASACAV